MTFSIAAFDARASDWGVVVASKFPAVGSVVPWARAGVGAVATQSWANTSFGPDGLDLMAGGLSAQAALDRLLADDGGREQRQVGIVDASGGVATFSGSKCMEWAGGVGGDGFVCQGNILTGEHVIREMVTTFERSTGDLVDKLLAALLAGDRAGGDRRGRQSAALLVVRDRGGYGGYTDRYVDLRVDDHPDAPNELARVFAAYDRDILIRNDPLLPASADLVAELQRRLSAMGRLDDEPSGEYDDATRRAIADFAGENNLEGKLRDDDQLFESIVREIRDVTPEID